MFDVHQNSKTGQIVKVDGKDLSELRPGPSGVFWIGDLPYGTYYIKERSPEKWFVLTVAEDGVGYKPADQTGPTAYSNQLTATANG